MSSRRSRKRAPVFLILLLMGWPWQIALPAIESSWTMFRLPASRRLDKLTDRSVMARAPWGANRREGATLIADDADDEFEEVPLAQAVIVLSGQFSILWSATTASSLTSASRSDIRPAPRISLRC